MLDEDVEDFQVFRFVARRDDVVTQQVLGLQLDELSFRVELVRLAGIVRAEVDRVAAIAFDRNLVITEVCRAHGLLQVVHRIRAVEQLGREVIGPLRLQDRRERLGLGTLVVEVVRKLELVGVII